MNSIFLLYFSGQARPTVYFFITHVRTGLSFWQTCMVYCSSWEWSLMWQMRGGRSYYGNHFQRETGPPCWRLVVSYCGETLNKMWPMRWMSQSIMELCCYHVCVVAITTTFWACPLVEFPACWKALLPQDIGTVYKWIWAGIRCVFLSTFSLYPTRWSKNFVMMKELSVILTTKLFPWWVQYMYMIGHCTLVLLVAGTITTAASSLLSPSTC